MTVAAALEAESEFVGRVRSLRRSDRDGRVRPGGFDVTPLALDLAPPEFRGGEIRCEEKLVATVGQVTVAVRPIGEIAGMGRAQ